MPRVWDGGNEGRCNYRGVTPREVFVVMEQFFGCGGGYIYLHVIK